jgi:putative NADH-flavin reductase
LSVTVLVRRPDKSFPDRVRVVSGDLLEDSTVLHAAVSGQDAVVSALGVGPSFTSGHLISRSAPAIVAAMRRHGVRRLVFTSAFGVGATRQDTPLLPRVFIATLLRDVYRDKQVGEQAILASDLDWTIVYPVGLTDGPRSGRYRVGERLSLKGFPRISRGDVAEFLLRQVEDRTYIRKGVLIAPE